MKPNDKIQGLIFWPCEAVAPKILIQALKYNSNLPSLFLWLRILMEIGRGRVSINIVTSISECAPCVWNYIFMTLLWFCLNQLDWKSSWTQFLSSNCLSIHITLVSVKDLLVQLFRQGYLNARGGCQSVLIATSKLSKSKVAEFHRCLNLHYKTSTLRGSSKFTVQKRNLLLVT